MTITFIGHGYVGLVSAAVFADLGNTVWVIGHTSQKVENLKKGIIPIYEPGLEELVRRNIKAKRLLFTMDYEPAVPSSDVVFIAVGTPPKENGEADLTVVFDVAGRVVRTLANNEPASSAGTILWNGFDDYSQRVRIGMYIILVEALDNFGGVVQTMKDVAVVATK